MKLQINITQEVLERTRNCLSLDFQNNLVDEKRPKKLKDTKKFAGWNCAIAYAVRNIFPNAFIGNYEITYNPFFNKENGYITGNIESKLPTNAVMFIREFDKLSPENRVKMKPFSFEIDVPEEVINSIGIQEALDIINKSETLQLVEV